MEALGVLRQAALLRDDPVVLTELGALATELELWSEAGQALQKAIRLEPGFARAHF
jgi:uncharacterized protein HemY